MRNPGLIINLIYPALLLLTLFINYSSAAFANLTGRVLRLQNEANGSVLDLRYWNTTPGTSIINQAINGATAQQWTFETEGDGYRIATIVPSPTCLPVVQKDGLAGTTAISINCFMGTRNQQWSFVLIGNAINGANLYIIRNPQHNCILQNNGNDVRVTCVPYDPNIIPLVQRWRVLDP